MWWHTVTHRRGSEEDTGEWSGVSSTIYVTSEHGVSSITTADAHSSAASNRLNWRPHRFKRTRPFRRKTKSCFCACSITFQTQYTHFCYRLIRPQCHIAAGMIMSMKYFNDSIGKRIQLPQPNVTPRITIVLFSLSCNAYGALSWRLSGRGVALDTCFHTAPGFKKGHSFTFTFTSLPCAFMSCCTVSGFSNSGLLFIDFRISPSLTWPPHKKES